MEKRNRDRSVTYTQDSFWFLLNNTRNTLTEMQSLAITFKSVFPSFILGTSKGIFSPLCPFQMIFFFRQISANYCMVTNCIILTRENVAKGNICNPYILSTIRLTKERRDPYLCYLWILLNFTELCKDRSLWLMTKWNYRII